MLLPSKHCWGDTISQQPTDDAWSVREDDLPVIALNVLLGVACLCLSSRWKTALIKIHYQYIGDWWQSRQTAWESVLPSKSNVFPTGTYRQFSNEGETPDELLMRGEPCTWAGETSEWRQRCCSLVVFKLCSWTYTASWELPVSESQSTTVEKKNSPSAFWHSGLKFPTDFCFVFLILNGWIMLGISHKVLLLLRLTTVYLKSFSINCDINKETQSWNSLCNHVFET